VLTGETLRYVEETLARSTTGLLQEFFGERIVGRDLWPPPSLDLAPSDFFLWGFLKERVHSNNPQSLDELKHNAEETAANTDPETFRKVT
jgi:hypothetical protein